MNLKAIIFFLGLFIFPLSFLAFINILYSLYFDYFLSVESYTFTLFITLFFGIIFYFIGRKSTKEINFYDQIMLIILVYFFSSLFISLPYYLSNYQITFINSLFESFSGITSTGFTIFKNIKYLDPTLILWRSSSQWIGGLYFLFFLILIFSNKQYNYKLCFLSYTYESGSVSKENIKRKLLQIFLIYSLISILIFVILNIAEIRLFNSLNLSMTLISNGGFLPTNSLGQIFNEKNEIFLLAALFLSMINIFFLFNIISKKKLINYHQEDLYLIFFAFALSFILYFLLQDLNLKQILINVISSLSNSGLTLSNSSENMTLLFLILCIIGGSIISNSSGIKLVRLYILLKTASSEILKLVRPNNVFNNKIFFSDKKIDMQIVNLSFLIFISFFISIFILSSVLVLDNINFENSFKLSVLTLTNTTNSSLFGLENINFANFYTNTKLFLIIFMIIGKIELISLFILFKKILTKN